jgi:transglutaminase-like putative cysteine protease
VVTRARVPTVTDRIEFEVTVVARRDGDGGAAVPVATLADRRLLAPTPLTAPDARLRRLAARLADRDVLATAGRYCAYVHEALTYEHGVTTVATTAAEALAGGRGVCQDSAHVMLALCRAGGLPARYVSGHLLGEGATHAWVEVVVAGPRAARAVAFDPCNGRRAGRDYLTVAVGRDYADVAPTSGTYYGAGRGTLSANTHVDVT